MAPSRNERETREARERLRRYEARQRVHDRRGARRRRDNIAAILAAVVVVGLAATAQVFYVTAGPGAPTAEPSTEASASPSPSAPAGENVGDVPDPTLAEGRTWAGTITINDIPLGVELDGATAPQATSVLIQGVQQSYYPGKTCHRLVDSDTFGVLQCGSLAGDGASDPTFAYGPIENAPADGVYPTGTIAMARGDSPYSNGRQFFICFKDTTIESPDGYTVVGRVTSGLDQLVAGIVAGGIADGATDGAPVTPASITGFAVD